MCYGATFVCQHYLDSTTNLSPLWMGDERWRACLLLFRWGLAGGIGAPRGMGAELALVRTIRPQRRAPKFPAADRTGLFDSGQRTRHGEAVAPQLRHGQSK
jgi:hypothetical protein